MNETPVLSVKELTKTFPGVVALDRVNLDFFPGTVVGLVGKNGAGKSTLIKVLSGAESQNNGKILIDGTEVRIHSPAEALERGVVAVHQRLDIFPGLTVAENVFLGRDRLPSRLGFVSRSQLYSLANRILSDLDIAVDPRVAVSDLRVPFQRMVTIARGLASGARKMMILDEPTESLTGSETEKLFEQINLWRMRGLCVLYVSHRLEEVLTLSNNIVVMRGGRVVEEEDAGHYDKARLIAAIKGESEVKGEQTETLTRDSQHPAIETKALSHVPVFEARNVKGSGFDNANIRIYAGEIVGLAGLVGSGRSSLAKLLGGIERTTAGEIVLEGHHVKIKFPADALAQGIIYVPEDRHTHALFPAFQVWEDVSISVLDKLRAKVLPWLKRRLAVSDASRVIDEFGVDPPNPMLHTSKLSGGNQQKVVLARLLRLSGKVLILDEPTQGVDVGTRKELALIIRAAARKGAGVVWISSDFQELMEVSDRIVVARNHQLVADFLTAEITEHDLLEACFGGVGAGSAS